MKYPPRPDCVAARAFTLIELLTVIAIIGILAAIMIPVTATVRKSARATADLSNMRQLGAAMMSYATDNRDTINVPIVIDAGNAPDTWKNNYWSRAAPYLALKMRYDEGVEAAKPFRNQTLPQIYLDTWKYQGQAGAMTFATNKGLNAKFASGMTQPEHRFRRLMQYANYLSVTPYIAVGAWGLGAGTPGPLPEVPPAEGVVWPYKGQRTIMVYLDGHAAWRATAFTWEDSVRDWDPNQI